VLQGATRRPEEIPDQRALGPVRAVHCLGLEEKPLILFKQLDKEGKKPMFMLRKTNNAQIDPGDAPGSAGLGGAAARGAATGYDPPGGII
jgi:protein STE50